MSSYQERKRTRQAETDRAPERKKRVPVSGEGRNILTIENRDPSYNYRWVNDRDGRIQRFLDGWWEFVPHSTTVGERHVDYAKDPSSVVSKEVGQGTTAYLMRIKKEYFEEDKAAKQRRIDETEESMFRELNKEESGITGKVSFERK